MSKNQYKKPKSSNDKRKWGEKLEEYHYNAYKNLIQISLFLNAAGITAVMATLGLKHKNGINTVTTPSEVKHFIDPSLPIDLVLNTALNYFLISIGFLVVCAIVEYISYFPRRSQKNACCNTCHSFCRKLIKIFEMIMFGALIAIFVFLIMGGLKFMNV